MPAVLHILRRRLSFAGARREDGLTIVEVVVAGLILVVGALGVLGIVDAAGRNTFRAEQSQVVANVLQAEMEKLKQLPYEELALTELPADSEDSAAPDSRIASTSFFYTGRGGTGLKPLVYNGGSSGGETIEGGVVEAGPDPFQVDDVKGEVYRYVVWDTCPAVLCQDGEHLKRLVVAVALDETASGGTRRYQEVQAQVVDPDAAPPGSSGQEPGGSETIPWTLWLTDTTCDQPARQPHPEAEGDHPTHNTRGDCVNGLREGNVPGAPDLLWPEPPNLPPKEHFPDPEEYPDYEYDYASELEPQPEDDAGLQLLPGGDCGSTEMTDLARGVATEPDADPAAFQKVHRWLSPPLPASEGPDDVLLTGEGTLSLWTRTVGGAVHPGRICAWLFVRDYPEEAIADTLVVNLAPPFGFHFDHFAQSWPSEGWTEVSLPLGFGHAGEGGALPLPAGSRLGLAVGVGGDTPNGLQVLYDEPSFDTRIQLETAGALPPGA